MLSYAEQRSQDILTLTEKVKCQVTMNDVFEATGINFRYNSEGRLVTTRAFSLSKGY